MSGHQSVLLKEALDALAIVPDGVYVDGTFGRGGHAQALLSRLDPNGTLIAIDKDPEAVRFGTELMSKDKRFHMMHGSFADMARFTEALNLKGKVNGILLDLGVSSPQIDNPERGFSFMQQGPLDMRMDLTQPLTAARFVNEADVDELISVFREYGEERYAPRIARAIIAEREQAPFTTTDHLAEVVKAANPNWEKHKHPATRVFQAIRIYVNGELSDLSAFLPTSLDVLAVGGRLAIISFHSLEDRIVKQFMRTQELGVQPPRGIPVRAAEMTTNFKRIGKMIKPSDEEIKENVRARSAVLRIGEKIA